LSNQVEGSLELRRVHSLIGQIGKHWVWQER
jgi:hypothetical protein